MPEDRNAWSAPNPDKICYSCGKPYSRPPGIECYLTSLHRDSYNKDDDSYNKEAIESKLEELKKLEDEYAHIKAANPLRTSISLRNRIDSLREELEHRQVATSNLENRNIPGPPSVQAQEVQALNVPKTPRMISSADLSNNGRICVKCGSMNPLEGRFCIKCRNQFF